MECGIGQPGQNGSDVGMDCAITALPRYDLMLIQTTDFFYPLVDDPYLQGRIGCANVLSDLYAMGIADCDNMLMILAASRKMNPSDCHIVTREMMKGFMDTCREAGTQCLGGQTVMNPWPIIGGVATSVRKKGDYVPPDGAQPGDILVLTKPLGGQVAVNIHQWRMQNEENLLSKALTACTSEEAETAYLLAVDQMARLNRVGAELMLKYGAHAATDITGFGLKGHANNLAVAQKANVVLRLHTLPILAHMTAVDGALGNMFRLLDGFSAETSGGLLVSLPSENAKAFCTDIEAREGYPAWIVGEVIARDEEKQGNFAEFGSDVTVIEV